MSILQEIKVLQEVANDRNAVITKIYFKNGDCVKKGDGVVELETSKAAMLVEAEKEGYIEYLYKEKSEVEVGKVIIRIHDNAQDAKVLAASPVSSKEVKVSQTLFSASALALMEQEKIDKSLFFGRDMIGLEDVQAVLNARKKEDIVIQKITHAKEVEIANLKDVQSANMNCVAAVYIDVEPLLKFADLHLDKLKDSLLPFLVFEIARLLSKYPEFNAFFTDGNIAFYQTINIGLAMDLGYGLRVLKLPGATQKGLKEIEDEILRMADKYLDKKLVWDDVSGITFTITDLSKQGVHFFTPLISKQQSAILGVSAVDEKLKRCILTLTFDHRVTEGKRAAEFLDVLKTRLESYKGDDQEAKFVQSAGVLDVKCSQCFAILDEVKQLNGLGLIKIVDCSGREKFLCQVCLLGWE